MRKLGLVAALFACVFGFCACEEEKEEEVELQINYYCLASAAFSEHDDIHLREYSASDETLYEFVIFHLGRKEETSYLPAQPDTKYVFLFYKTNYCDPFDSTIFTNYFKKIVTLKTGNNYISLAGGEEITEQEFRELQKAKTEVR